MNSDSKDVDLQRAKLQEIDLKNRAEIVAGQFQMSLEGALQLTQLADTMQLLSAQNKFTGEDQIAISQAALSVAGISQEEFRTAMADFFQRQNKRAFDPLIEKGAKNLGMPSSVSLRDQILPSLGLNLNQL